MRDFGDENDFKGNDALKLKVIASHPNLSDQINANLAQSAIEGGAWLKDLAIGKALRITTRNSVYTIRKQADGTSYRLEQEKAADGGYKLKDNPVLCKVNGSTWGGSMIKVGFVGRGMRLECSLPSAFVGGVRTLTTSPIQDIEEIK